MTSARDDLTGGANAPLAIVPDSRNEAPSYRPAEESPTPHQRIDELEAATEELRSLRAELEEAIRENLERRQANRALDREIVQLRAMLAEAERQMGNIRQTFIYRIGEIIVSARTWKGFRQLPRRLVALRRVYLEKRGLLDPPGKSRAGLSDRLRHADEAIKILSTHGFDAALSYARAVPARDSEGKARALLELAHAVYLQDPARAASLAVEAGDLQPTDARLRALVLLLFDHGEVDAPALILSTLNETLMDTPIDRARRATILAHERQLASPLVCPPCAAPTIGPARVAVVAPRSLPHHLDAEAFRAQAVMDAAREAGLDAWLVTPPGYQYPTKGDGEIAHRTLGSTHILRLPGGAPPAGVFDVFISEIGAVLAKEFSQRGVTRVHALGDPSWCAAACWAARVVGAAFTLDVGEMPAFGSDVDSDWAKRERFRSGLALFAEVARSADRTIVRSRAVANAFLEQGLLQDVEIIDDLVPLDMNRASDAAVADVRSQFGLADQKIIGVFEFLDLDEGLYDLLSAFVLVRSKHPDTVVIFLGAGRGAETLRQRAAILGVSDHVLMPSDAACRKIADHLSAFTVAVFPKRRMFPPGLSAPFELQSALAVGVPVVAVDTPWAREWIVDGVSGLSVAVGDVEALAEAIKKVLGASEMAERLGRNGRDLIQARSNSSVIHPLVAATFQGGPARVAA